MAMILPTEIMNIIKSFLLRDKVIHYILKELFNNLQSQPLKNLEKIISKRDLLGYKPIDGYKIEKFVKETKFSVIYRKDKLTKRFMCNVLNYISTCGLGETVFMILDALRNEFKKTKEIENLITYLK